MFSTAARNDHGSGRCPVRRAFGRLQSAHVDHESSRAGPFGAPIAHGLLVLSVASGLGVQTGIFTGTNLAFLGIEDLRFVGAGAVRRHDSDGVDGDRDREDEQARPGNGQDRAGDQETRIDRGDANGRLRVADGGANARRRRRGRVMPGVEGRCARRHRRRRRARPQSRAVPGSARRIGGRERPRSGSRRLGRRRRRRGIRRGRCGRRDRRRRRQRCRRATTTWPPRRVRLHWSGARSTLSGRSTSSSTTPASSAIARSRR